MPEPRLFLLEDRLDSWKEIASYLNRDVRTVQRWEKNSDLPVHRLKIEKAGPVYAYKSELDAWWKERQSSLEIRPEPHPPPRTKIGNSDFIVGDRTGMNRLSFLS